MAEANAAYEAGDVEQLQAILDDWENSPDAVSGDGTGADLVRVIRAIAAVEARLAALSEELVACAESSLAELYAKAQIAEAEGRDLLQELAQDVDRQIAEARQRLAELSGDLESVRG